MNLAKSGCHPRKAGELEGLLFWTIDSRVTLSMSGREASGTDANMTTPNQLIEVPHLQPHDHASTSGGPRTNGERFSTFVDDEELAALSKGVVPAGTDKCTKCALANFAAWKKAP